jgi:hypothetical protein
MPEAAGRVNWPNPAVKFNCTPYFSQTCIDYWQIYILFAFGNPLGMLNV